MTLIEGTYRKSPVSERAVLVKTDGRSDAVRSVETRDGLAGSLNRTWRSLFGIAHFRYPYGIGLRIGVAARRTCAF